MPGLSPGTPGPQVRLFDTATLSCTAALVGHTDTVLAIDARPALPGAPAGCTTLLVSGAKDRSIRLWEAPSGRCIGRGEGHISAVSAVAFSCKTGAFIVSGGADKLLKVWDLAVALERLTGAAAAEPAAKKEGGKKGSHPAAAEGSEAAAGDSAVRELKVTAAVAAHDKDINAVAVSPNDAFICTASQDRTAKVCSHQVFGPGLKAATLHACLLLGFGVPLTSRFWAASMQYVM